MTGTPMFVRDLPTQVQGRGLSRCLCVGISVVDGASYVVDVETLHPSKRQSDDGDMYLLNRCEFISHGTQNVVVRHGWEWTLLPEPEACICHDLCTRALELVSSSPLVW